MPETQSVSSVQPPPQTSPLQVLGEQLTVCAEGQSGLLPVQFSGRVATLVEPSQLALRHDTVAGACASAGQSGLSPGHSSSAPHTPPAARQEVPAEA